MTGTARMPSKRAIAMAFLQECRMRFYMDPVVTWTIDGPSSEGVLSFEEVERARPESVTLTWDWFVHLASAAMDQQARLR